MLHSYKYPLSQYHIQIYILAPVWPYQVQQVCFPE